MELQGKYFIVWITALIFWVLFVVFYLIACSQAWEPWAITSLNSGMWVSNIVMWMASYYNLKNEIQNPKNKNYHPNL